MKEIIEREKKCINDCIVLAHTSFRLNNLNRTKTLLEDALKSIKTIEELDKDETNITVTLFVDGRNHNDNY